MGQQLVDVQTETAHVRSAPRTARIAIRAAGQLPPELGTLGRFEGCDLQSQRIAVRRMAIAQQLVRGGFEDFAERQKKSEIDALLVAFDSRQSGDADLGPARYIIE